MRISGRRWLLVVAGLMAGCASSLMAGCASSATADGANRPVLRSESTVLPVEPVSSSTSVPPPTTAPQPDRAEQILAGMSLEEKIGQLFMPVLSGHDVQTVTAAEERANREATGWGTPGEVVEAYHLGGIIYLANNISTPDQVGLLSNGLQTVAHDDTGIGLLVAVDQEGGRVNRITDGVTVFPSAAVLSGDSDAVREAGYLTGLQVSGLGVNVVLAPVADVTRPGVESFIGNRSYGNDPQVVADMVSASVDGLQDSGVAAAVKHWPGHGGTEVDSHRTLPVLDVSRPGWDERERLPFQAAVENDVAIVLVGHLAIPAIDPDGAPATVSPVMIDGLLRDELGFDGVVMTDALNMGAVSDIDPGQLVVGAVRAGVDVLLVPPDLAVAYEALRSAVETGEITEHRLDESVLRVLRLKDHLGLLPPD
jgi:beta-N-acetylhexosaminidase